MNCIIYALYNSHHMPLLEVISKKYPLEFCYIIGNKESNKIPLSFIQAAKFHDWHDIYSGYKNLKWDEIKPLDAVLIEKMRSCEVQVLRMMDRYSDSLNESWTYAKRKKLYLEHLRYWDHCLDIKKIDFFWSLNVPHEVIDFIIFYLCKVRKIPILFFFNINQNVLR